MLGTNIVNTAINNSRLNFFKSKEKMGSRRLQNLIQQTGLTTTKKRIQPFKNIVCYRKLATQKKGLAQINPNKQPKEETALQHYYQMVP